MTEGYLSILKESLEKKIEVLNRIRDLEKEQLQLAMQPDLDFEKYDESVTIKGNLIDELNKLDDGFVNTYELIRDEIQEHKEKYPEEIKELQALISKTTDMVVEIQAGEKRNKDAIEFATANKRRELNGKHISTVAAHKYYKAMSGINTVDPQLMDRKK